MGPMRFVLPSLVILAAAPATVAQEVSYDVLAPELVAVELASVELALDVPVLDEILARHGLGLASAEPFGPRTFRLLELSAPVENDVAHAALLSELLSMPGVVFATAVYRDELGLPELPSRGLIVRFEPGVPADLQRALLETQPGLAAPEQPWAALPGYWTARTTARLGHEVLARAAALRALPGVRWAQPDRIAGAVLHDTFPNDLLFSQSWGQHNTGQTTGPIAPSTAMWTGTPDVDMDLPEAWDITQGSAAITVVVFDGGIDLGHPDLPVTWGADFTGQNMGGAPLNAGACHGTAVAGCITATMDNNIGVAGTASGCALASAAVMIPQSFLSCTNNTSFMSGWLVSGLDFALMIGARVTCSSFGLGFDQAIADAYADTKMLGGIVHFASSGNNAPFPIGFPANDDDVVAVGNLRPDGTIGPSSQFGALLDLVAPGTNIITTDWSGQPGYADPFNYAMVNGTSFAAPYAAGVGALVLSQYPSLTPDEVRLVLKMSAVDLGAACEDSVFGAGLVNAHRALLLSADFAGGSVHAYNGGGQSAWFTSVTDAVNGAAPGQLVLVHEGSFAESLTITKPLLLRQWTTLEGSCGPAVVGE